jgi:hypothetical protein
MRQGDVVQLLADQPLAPPLGTIPRGTIGEVISAPPALWVFKFPGYVAVPVKLDQLRAIRGLQAWPYRLRRFWLAQVQPKVRLRRIAPRIIRVGIGPLLGLAGRHVIRMLLGW